MRQLEERPQRWAESPPSANPMEGRAQELFRHVPAPRPLSSGQLARVEVALAAQTSSGNVRFLRGVRPRVMLGAVAGGAVALAATSPSLRQWLSNRWEDLRPTPSLGVIQAPVVQTIVATPTSVDASPPEVALPAVKGPASPASIALTARPTNRGPVPLSEGTPSSAGRAPRPVANTLAEETALLERAISARREGRLKDALATLDRYPLKFPSGQLWNDVRVARLDVLLGLGRRQEALSFLDSLAPTDLAGLPRANELRVVHGQLLAEAGRYPEAIDLFDAALAGNAPSPVAELALYGRAVCKAKQGDVSAARADFREYLDRFPTGPHAEAARARVEP